MEIKEFSTQFAKLCFAFDKEPQEGQMLIYYEYLQGFPIDHFAYAVNNLIRNNKFFPKISEILDDIKNVPPEANNYLQLTSNEKLPTKKEVRDLIIKLKESLSVNNSVDKGDKLDG